MADPQKMKFYGVSMLKLAGICKGISENSTGGMVRQYAYEYVVRGVARTSDFELLGNSFIKSINGKSVKIRDVADVKIGSGIKMGYASENVEPVIIISISKQPNINTFGVTERIEDNLTELIKTLPPDVILDTKVFRQADFIETSVRNVQNALIEGGNFVIIILFLFLVSFRTTIISLLAIPLSLLGAILAMKVLDLNINTMWLSGMVIAIAIDSLVDDAIISVENIHRRLRQNHNKPLEEKESVFSVVFEACKEIRTPIINPTLIIIMAFLPLFFLSEMEGRMLKPLGISFVVFLFVSLIVAMTLTPPL